uniref:Uncharacterized protein n=1 Tax=Arundo donax TaxID=35708 RepID=A0A0A8Y3G8_ARUDO
MQPHLQYISISALQTEQTELMLCLMV